MPEYLKLAWRQVVLRFLIDAAAAILVLIPTYAIALSIFALSHAVWNIPGHVLKQSLSALAALYLLVLVAGTMARHWRLLSTSFEQVGRVPEKTVNPS